MDIRSDRPTTSKFRFGKVLFASYAVAVGLLILTVVVGLFVVGFEPVDKYVLGNGGVILILLTATAFPFVRKHLK